MPLYNDRFSGHYFPGDPRTPLSVAGGCIWPTVPGYRYYLDSTNATGVLSELNTVGCLFTRTNNNPDHDDGSWMLVSSPLVVASGSMRKVWNPNIELGTWVIQLELQSGLGKLIWIWSHIYHKCNQDKQLWSRCVESGCHIGETGDQTRLRQVVWDEIKPPS